VNFVRLARLDRVRTAADRAKAVELHYILFGAVLLLQNNSTVYWKTNSRDQNLVRSHCFCEEA
jgi:hypothetical protein